MEAVWLHQGWTRGSRVPPRAPPPVSDSIKSQPRVRTKKEASRSVQQPSRLQMRRLASKPSDNCFQLRDNLLAFEQQILFCVYLVSCSFPLSVSSSAGITYPNGPLSFNQLHLPNLKTNEIKDRKRASGVETVEGHDRTFNLKQLT